MIRAATRDDLPAVKRVIDAAGLFPSSMLDEMIEPYLAPGAAHEFWLVAGEDQPVGVAYCTPERMTDGAWNLLLIAIHPGTQRQGLGTALIHAVEERVMEQSGRLLLIETSGLGTFSAQRAFYRTLGYAEEARVRDFYQPGEDKVVFRKSLT